MAKKDWLVLIGIILFTVLCTPAKAQQNKVIIKGTVVESMSNEPLEAANVRLLSGSDSTMLNLVPTGIDGSFLLDNVSLGTYYLLITYVGFEPVYYPLTVENGAKNIDAETVAMEESITMLDEVVVTAGLPDFRRFWRRGRMQR